MNLDIKRKKHKLVNMVLDAKMMLEKPTEREKELADKLRSDIHAIIEKESLVDSSKAWDLYRKNLRACILKKDMRNFLRWDVIMGTMFHECRKEELDYLENLPSWPEWETALAENAVGNPKPYASLASSSGNLIHHAYHFAQCIEATTADLSKLGVIFEFGGGYGSMCRLAYKLGFTGTYVIFDLPEFIALQAYYLDSLSLREKHRIVLCSNEKDVERFFQSNKADMFIATWSISESPVLLRESLLKAVRNPVYYLIAYQRKFFEINNAEYFKKLAEQKKEYEWKVSPIDHLPGNDYLFGKKK